MDTIIFSSSTELGIEYNPMTGEVPNVVPLEEVDAIIVKPLNVDSASVAEIGGNTQGTLYIDFIIGALTGVNIRFYGSRVGNPVAADWRQEVVETDTAGVATLDPFSIRLTASTRIAYHFPVGAYQAFKVTIEGTGVGNAGSAIKLNLGLRNN